MESLKQHLRDPGNRLKALEFMLNEISSRESFYLCAALRQYTISIDPGYGGDLSSAYSLAQYLPELNNLYKKGSEFWYLQSEYNNSAETVRELRIANIKQAIEKLSRN